MRAPVALLLAVSLAGACKKQQKPPPPERTVTPMSAAEIKRSEDACQAYVDRICTCEVPEAVKQCELAKALPDAVRIALEVAASPDSKPDIIEQAYAGVRKTVKECIEQMAQVPTLGCP